MVPRPRMLKREEGVSKVAAHKMGCSERDRSSPALSWAAFSTSSLSYSSCKIDGVNLRAAMGEGIPGGCDGYLRQRVAFMALFCSSSCSVMHFMCSSAA